MSGPLHLERPTPTMASNAIKLALACLVCIGLLSVLVIALEWIQAL